MAKLSRRQVLSAALALGIPRAAQLQSVEPIHKKIPKTGEQLPVIGMGSWITFDVRDGAARSARVPIINEFFGQGGTVVDSSPMYGSSPDVIGHCLEEVNSDAGLFSASKVWVRGVERGEHQMAWSLQRWGIERFDLMQIHNMMDWQAHLPILTAMKERGDIRYIGITTSHGRRHRQLAQALKTGTFDFVQLSYNIADREVEKQLLPLARDLGIAVMVNRPFRTGGLFAHVQREALPGWAADIDCKNWAQVFLKFVVSHPAVTVAIPATSRLEHMRQNMGALYGSLPDQRLRRRMAEDFSRI